MKIPDDYPNQPATATDPETELRALWTAQGVPVERQNAIIAEVKHKATPEYWKEFWNRLEQQRATITQAARTELTPIGEQYVIPGCEKKPPATVKQLNLWD